MQKIMFNDKYGLTQAVLKGKKTQTRRLASKHNFIKPVSNFCKGKLHVNEMFRDGENSKYAVGEVLAVAQSDETIYTEMSNRPEKDFYYPTVYIKNIDSLVNAARNTKVADILKLQDHPEIIRDKATKSEIVTIKKHQNLLLNKLKPSALQNFIQAFSGNPSWENKMFVKAEFMHHQIRITDIRFERLQDITNEDCLKEGIKKSWWTNASGKQLYGFGENDDRYTSPREAYAALINKISGKETWEKNPWVFVYDFELVK